MSKLPPIYPCKSECYQCDKGPVVRVHIASKGEGPEKHSVFMGYYIACDCGRSTKIYKTILASIVAWNNGLI